MVDTLDTAAVRRWSEGAVAALEAHRGELDRLNVFPIADSDTGTNLVLTMRAAADALAAGGADGAGDCLAVLARGAVLGARGNSGVIMSQLLRSLADTADGKPTVDAATLRSGLLLGAEEARTAVTDPVEGTILSVAQAAAAAVPVGTASAREVAGIALAAAEEAVRRTPDQLPELGGLVDAGGRGLAVVLAALVRALGGDADTEFIPQPPPPVGVGETFAYEVQYLLEAGKPAADALRAGLSALGDSVVVVGTGDGIWNVHAHVDDAGAAVEAGVLAGRPYRISVVKFAEPQSDATRTTVIAVAPGEGLTRLFEAEGVQVVAGTALTERDVLAAITASGAQRVVLLPNASRITGVAEAAAEHARSAGVRVAVVPTRSPVQGLAAVAVHDAARPFDDDVVAMAEAAAATRFAEVTRATEEALTAAGICQPGDLLGLIDGEVVDIGHGLVAVAFALTDRLLAVGAELMTVLVGADAQTGLGEVIARHVRERSPLTEVSVYDVGQPRYPLIIGVE